MIDGGDPVTEVGLPSIVVVDDDAPSRHLVTRYLQKLRLGNPVVTAGSVAEALGVIEGLALPPILLLLDVGLPDGSGFDLVRALPSSGHCRPAVVFLTGSDEMHDLDEAYALGAHSYLVKPVAVEALGDILQRVGLPWALLYPGDEAAG